ncbi:MAG: isoprenylcysteine carboxylmethyltransferase family protein [Thermodesulfobacteriota bacterium]
MKDGRRIVCNALWKLAVALGVVAGALFLSAGSRHWPEAWLFTAVLGACLTTNTVVLLRGSPDLVEERLHRHKGAKKWDLVVVSTASVFWLMSVPIAGLDRRFGWSPELGIPVKLASVAAFILGDLLVLWAMAVNRFFSRMVRIQTERGHHTVTAGPYRYVRHPGYVGWCFMAASMPLMLGSLWSLALTGLSVVLMVVRTALEDRTLQEELEGYREYTRNVPYRLIPGIW